MNVRRRLAWRLALLVGAALGCRAGDFPPDAPAQDRPVLVERAGVAVAGLDGVSALAVAELAATFRRALDELSGEGPRGDLEIDLVPRARLAETVVAEGVRGPRLLLPWDEATTRGETGEGICRLLLAARSAGGPGRVAPRWLVTGLHRALVVRGDPALLELARESAERAEIVPLGELLSSRGVGGGDAELAAFWLVQVLRAEAGWLDACLAAPDPAAVARAAVVRAAGAGSGDDAAAWWPVVFRERSDSVASGFWSASRSAWHADRLARLVVATPGGAERVLRPPAWDQLAGAPELAGLLAGRFVGVRFDLARVHPFRFNELLSAARAAGAAARGDAATAREEGARWLDDRAQAAALDAAVGSLLDR